jgi:protein-L-isoaspartate(D-aspartate) O-methyltransferase
MVREQIESRGVRNQQVLAAMQAVRRHHFVPADQVAAAYQDRPLPIGFGQTISQPYIVAFMTELLMLEGAERVLEIGTGSGYQAAVLAEITPHVFTIEIIPELAARAASWLRAEGYIGIQVKSGDGYHGWPEHGPYDRIIVTAAAGHVPPPLIEQLKPGGRIVIPVGGVFDVQQLTVVDKHADGSLTTRQVLPVRFVPLTGQGLAPDG